MPTAIIALALLIALVAGVLPTQSQPASCPYDKSKTLGLDFQAFDQDPNSGWRAVDRLPGCHAIAADMIRDYRLAHPRSQQKLLYWHEAQVRVSAGQTPAAIELFRQSRDDQSSTTWNAYVEATVAFLQRDRAGLQAARDQLAAFPKPVDFEQNHRSLAPGAFQPTWPPNLNVVDGLLKCFGKPYEEAYSAPCTAPLPAGAAK